MSFFGNDAINRVNLQGGVQALAQGAGGLFLLVFLIRQGLPVPLAFLTQAAIVALRFAVRPVMLPLAIRFGLKPLLIAGAVAMAAQFPLLAEVRGVDAALLAFGVVCALADVLFYVPRNAYFAAAGDAEHRGKQVAVGQALEAAAGVIAPLLGAWGLLTVGPRWTFGAVALVQAASAIPLIGLPNIAVARHAPGAWEASRPAALIIAIDGWFDAGFLYVWQVALFLTLGQSYSAYGGVMALAGLVGAVCGLTIGHHEDLRHGRRAVQIPYGVAASIAAFRAASLGAPWLAGIANAMGGVVFPLLVPPLGTVTHNLAKASPCPLRNKITSEGGWDVGCFVVCCLAAALAWKGAPSWLWMLITVPAAFAGGAALWPYFARRKA
jgi:DHA1 family inner membrane transport protein